MRVRRLHAFEDLAPTEAVALQRRLAGRVRRVGPLPRRLHTVAGIDCSHGADGTLHASVVVCAAPDWEVVEEVHAAGVPPLPYIPGLLSFREAPVELEALRGVRSRPEVLLVDGQGIAHPRRLGIASHVGLHLDVPTVGVGKSRLCGEHDEPAPGRGATTPLRDGRERLGTVVRTREGVRPVYVSVGHGLGLRPAVRAVLACATRYRLPEPIRHADRLSRARARQA